mgnify:CR=1 FL=1
MLIIAPKMQHIVFYASFSMPYVFLYLIGLAQVISFLFYVGGVKIVYFFLCPTCGCADNSVAYGLAKTETPQVK